MIVLFEVVQRNFTYNKRRPLRLISPFNNAVVASEAFIVGECFDNTQNVNINIGGISRNFSCTSNQFNGLMNISSLATGVQSVFISHAGQTVNSSIEK